MIVVAAAWTLLAAGCSGNDASNVAAGSGPIVTTPPLAVPPTLAVPGDEAAPAAIATTAPIEIAETATVSAPTATAAPLVITPLPTSTPGVDTGDLLPTGVPVVEATAVPAAVATGVPVVEATAVPAPVTSASGSRVSLGDFEVVNLVTRQNQNIAELAPSGATMLWFWAPH